MCIRDRRDTNAAADDVTDDEIRDAIKLLAETEGIFAETAGGVTVGVAKKLIASGKIPKDSSAVICVTGNGLKTLDAVNGYCGKPREIKPSPVSYTHLPLWIFVSNEPDAIGTIVCCGSRQPSCSAISYAMLFEPSA